MGVCASFNFRPAKMLALNSSILVIILISIELVDSMIVAQIKDGRKMAACTIELKNANDSLSVWADAMRKLITENSYTRSAQGILKEETQIQENIRKFGADLNRKPIEKLVNDLVLIKRKSNRLALEVYLKTLDIKWPQSSIQVGVSVERVQRACLSNLDRAAMMLYSSPSSSQNKFG